MKHSFWKKLFRKTMTLAIVSTMLCPAYSALAAGDVRIYINNEYLQGSELAYVNAKGYTMVPMRAISEALNAEVIYNNETKTITCISYDGNRIITFVVGGNRGNINGASIPLSCPVEVKNGRTLLPFRDTATLLGITDIEWDPTTRSAYLWTDAAYHYDEDDDNSYYYDEDDDDSYYYDEDDDDSYYYDEGDDDSYYYDEDDDDSYYYDEDDDDSYYYDEDDDDSYYYDEEDNFPEHSNDTDGAEYETEDWDNWYYLNEYS